MGVSSPSNDHVESTLTHHGNLRYDALLARIHDAYDAGARNGLGSSGALRGLRALAATALLDGSARASALHADGDDAGSTAAAVSALLQDVQRVRLYIRAQFEQLWARLLDVVGQARSAAEDLHHDAASESNAKARMHHEERLKELWRLLERISDETVQLDGRAWESVASCAHLAQLADRRGGEQDAEVQQSYVAASEAALLGDLKFDPLILGLSDGFELLRLAESDATAAAAAVAAAGSGGAVKPRWVAPKQFRRVTKKFWLLPQDVVKFKAEVVKQLPVLIYADRQKLTEVDPSVLPFLPPPATSDSGPISSVYLDALPELPSYHSRLRRDDMATAIRVRWYGNRDPYDPEQQLFIERKVHREAFTDEWSTKQRVGMKQRDVTGFLALDGQRHPEVLTTEGQDSDAAFLADVKSHILEEEQVPLIRTSYRRTAFQLSTNNLVRISMDTDLVMSREAFPPWEKQQQQQQSSCTASATLPGDWCRSALDVHHVGSASGLATCGAAAASVAPNGRSLNYPQQQQQQHVECLSLRPSDLVRFPYAVVEIKLQSKPPAWLKDLVRGGMLLPAPKFSKFQHGTAVLYQQLTENVPHWFMPDESDRDVMTPATWDEMAGKTDPYLRDRIADWLFPGAEDETQPPPAPEPLATPKNVQRKGSLLRLFRRRTLPGSHPVKNEKDTSSGATASHHAAASIDAAATHARQPPHQHQAVASEIGAVAAPAAYISAATANAHSPSSELESVVVIVDDAEHGEHAAEISAPHAAGAASAVANGRGVQAHGMDESLVHPTTAVDNNGLQREKSSKASSNDGNFVGDHPHSAGTPSGSERERAQHQAATGRSTPQDSAEDLEAGLGGSPAHRHQRMQQEQQQQAGLLSPLPRSALSASSPSLQHAHGLPDEDGAGGIVEPHAEKSYGLMQYSLPFMNGNGGNGVGAGFGTAAYKGGQGGDGGNDAPLLPSRRTSSTSRAMVRTRVEPKTFFANERTFLQWLNISVLVMFLALSLLSGSTLTTMASSTAQTPSARCSPGDSGCFASRLSGALIAPVALAFMAYALLVYKKRTVQILRRETVRYDDQRGPVILVVVLIAVMLISYVLSLIYVF